LLQSIADKSAQLRMYAAAGLHMTSLPSLLFPSRDFSAPRGRRAAIRFTMAAA
jgi:hypothetical protein